MRRIILIIAVVVSGCLWFHTANAQASIRFGVNIGNQPEWGPTGYHNARYYYMPDIDAYYDVNAHQYVYFENNTWVHGGHLPGQYKDFDRYHSYKVVVNQRNPWEHHEDIRTRYSGYKGRHDQQIIRDSHDFRYHGHWKDQDDQHGQDGHRGQDGH